MYLNSEKLKGHYLADFVYCGGGQNITPAINEGPLCVCVYTYINPDIRAQTFLFDDTFKTVLPPMEGIGGLFHWLSCVSIFFINCAAQE